MYVLKCLTKDGFVYYKSTIKKEIYGSLWEILILAVNITGAKKYRSLERANADLKKLRPKNFKIYPVCPMCKKEYDGYPAISRKDNKTEICSNCGSKEALLSFAQEVSKEKIEAKS